MKFRGILGTGMSGSIDGVVASHNRGGAYFRNRSTPVNPSSPAQVAVRSFFAQLGSAWRDTLTPAERAGWDTYALNTLLPNALGDPVNVGGLGMYQRGNVARLQAGLTRVDTPPSVFGLPTVTPPTLISITAATGVASIGFTPGDAWANADGAALLVYGSRPNSPAINFFKGPYRFAGKVDGNSTTAPTSPAAINMPFALIAGQKAFVKVTVTGADGRYSGPFRLAALAV